MDSTPQGEPKVRQRVRIRFCKQGDLRLMGHRDLARLLERLFRRAGSGPGHERRVSSQAADELSLRPGRGNRRTRRSDGSGTGPGVHRRRFAGATARPCHARPRLPIASTSCPQGPEAAEARVGSVTYQIAIPADAPGGRDRADRAASGLPGVSRYPTSGSRRADRPAASPWKRSTLADGGALDAVSSRPSGPARDRATCWRRWDWPTWSARGACLRRTAVEVLP